jgi:hypothetical protein
MLRLTSAGIALTVLRRAAAAENSRCPLIAVIYDERHADARAFAEHLQRQGAASFATRGDATSLWYGDPSPRNAGTIAGLTTWSDLVIARSHGREFGMRLAFEKPHGPGSSDHLFAWLLTPRTVPGGSCGSPGGRINPARA